MSRARLFIYFCFWVANALHTLDSLFLSLARAHFSLSQAAAGKEENAEEEEAQDGKEVKETEEEKEEEAEEGTQEEKYGRNCRRSSSSADCKASMRHNKNGETALVCERKGKKNKKSREILKILINTTHIRRE